MIYIESDCVLYAGYLFESPQLNICCGGRTWFCLFVFLSRIVCQVVLGFVYSFSCYGLFVYIDNWLKDSAYKHSILLCILFVIKVYIALHDVTFEQENELTSKM